MNPWGGLNVAEPVMFPGAILPPKEEMMNTFVSGLDTIPYTVQRMSSLHDITRRMEFEQEDLGSSSLQEVA